MAPIRSLTFGIEFQEGYFAGVNRVTIIYAGIPEPKQEQRTGDLDTLLSSLAAEFSGTIYSGLTVGVTYDKVFPERKIGQVQRTLGRIQGVKFDFNPAQAKR
ncbi:MAG: hypothetical protein HYW26_05895 [Candidatus Aenigmarchaeota archaeon]|nr:hypothetical protein [Candidatus Aenigmarchaeota archaeon]